MMPNREIAILAKSRKCGNYCIAGKEIFHSGNEIVVGNWIRPVSGRVGSKGAVSNRECKCSGNSVAGVLDFVKVPFSKRMAKAGQPENTQLSAQAPWVKTGELSATALEQFEDSPGDIWLEPNMPTDHVTHQFAVNVDASLYFIRPTVLILSLSNDFNPYYDYYVRKIRAEFTYAGVRYSNLSVTDPKIVTLLNNEFPLKGQQQKRVTLPGGDDYYLCVSLGPQFGAAGFHYKFVATVLDSCGHIQRIQ